MASAAANRTDGRALGGAGTIVGGELQRSQVYRSGQDWLDTRDEWRAAMLEKRWR